VAKVGGGVIKFPLKTAANKAWMSIEEKSDWNRTRLIFYTIGRLIYYFRSILKLGAFYDTIDSKIHSLHRIDMIWGWRRQRGRGRGKGKRCLLSVHGHLKSLVIDWLIGPLFYCLIVQKPIHPVIYSMNTCMHVAAKLLNS
jgi:hypothetical protein